MIDRVRTASGYRNAWYNAVVPRIAFGVLGPLEVWVSGRVFVIRGRKQRLLLALLLLRAGEVVSTDRLLADIWGERPPKTAVSSLQNMVSQLRKALGSDVVRTSPAGYSIYVQPESFDLHNFERLVADARASDSAQRRSAQLETALALWRGPPLGDFAFESSTQLEIARLEELRTTTREELIEAKLELGQHGRLVSELEALVSEHPLRERLRAQLMLALYRSGRQTEALAAYQNARRTLTGELGLVPSEELQQLERAILGHDEGLEQPTSVRLGRSAPTAGPERPGASVEPARKTVTILFADIVDSTLLAEQVDPELLRHVIGRYFDVARTALERHGGTVEKFIGDAVMAVFGIPQLHEDDALRGVRAAIDLLEAVRTLGADLALERGLRLEARIGVNTGVVFSGDSSGGQQFATGEAVNVAKRLEQAAGPGEILLGAQTYALVSEAVRAEPSNPLALKGRIEPVQSTRLLELLPEVPAFERADNPPFVGRERELRVLRESLASAIEQQSCQVCTVIGSPGIGKSRLVREFAATVAEGPRFLAGRCLPYGEGITYWPLAEIVRQLTDHGSGLEELLSDAANATLVSARIREAIGASAESAGLAVEISWAFRKLFEALAVRQPLVVVIDDLHWAEPALLDLLEYIAAFSSTAPMLLLCLARGDLLEARAAWASPRPSVSVISLQPLTAADSLSLAADLGDRLDVPEAERGRVVSVAEGNPLFLEQLLLHWSHEDGTHLPPTIEALLAARIDRLEPEERTLTIHASIQGKRFHRGALAELLPEQARTELGRRLMGLVRKELIDADRSDFPGDDGFRFRHILIRDAAYESSPKELRAHAHEFYADWLERQTAERSTEYEEIVGYHLERAYHYRVELASPDPDSHGLAGRAAARLSAAGTRAYARGDMWAAHNLLTRATDLLPARDPARLELLPQLSITLMGVRDFEGEEAVLAEALDAAIELGLPALEWHTRLRQVRAKVRCAEATSEQVLRVAEEAISVFSKLDDELGQAAAWRLRATALDGLGKLTAAMEAGEQAIQHARRAHSEHDELMISMRSMRWLPWGPMPVEDAIRRCEETISDLERSPLLEVDVFGSLACLLAMQDRFEQARSTMKRAHAVARDIGLPYPRAVAAHSSAFVETLADDPASAERDLRRALEIFEGTLEQSAFATGTALLAQALCAQGQYAEAEELTRQSEQAATTDDVWSQVPWRSARAKVLTRRCELDQAETYARDAVRLAAETELVNMHGDALLDLGEVLQAAERTDEAAEVTEKAGRLYHRKGNIVSARKAALTLKDLGRMSFERSS